MKKPKKIVIVEDDCDLLFLLGKVFRQAGYAVDCLRDGSLILEGGYSQTDLFVVDKASRYVDGLTICNYLKSQRRTKDIPVVMMSGTMQFETEALKAGVRCFLEKPLHLVNLLQTIKSLTSNDGGKKYQSCHKIPFNVVSLRGA